MVTPNLPSLDKNGRILRFDKAGVWTRLDSLDDLAKSLEVNAAQIDLARLKSVPDPWGHITSFRDSLFAVGDSHPAHRGAVQIWRAMLAILGLRAFHSRFTLHAEAVDLEEAKPADDKINMFRGIVQRFVPNDTFDARLGWKRLWLLLASVNGRDELLGLLSPLTLVAPARGIRPDLVRELAGDPRDFGSPLGGSLYTPEELRALQLFVGSLAQSVRSATPGSSRLIELLTDYQRDLAAAGAADAYPQPSEVTRPLGDLSAQTNFAALDRVWQPGESEPASDSFIVTSENFRKVFEGAVLADPALGVTLGRPADRIVLWRGRRLSALADLAAIRSDAHKIGDNGYVIVAPDDLLSPILTPFDKAAISAHGAGELSQMLLPVTPLALLLWPARDLLNRLTVRADGTDRWIVELRVSLVGRDGRPYDHILRREYHSRQTKRGDTASLALVENDVRAVTPAALAAWPDFAGAQWRWNFLYFDAQHKQAAVPTSGLSTQMLVKDLGGKPSCAERWNRIVEWASPEGPWKGPFTRQMDGEQRSWFERVRFATNDPDQDGGNEKELQRCDTAFDAVSFVVNDPSRILPGSKLGAQFAGIGLLQPSAIAPQITELGAEVATDFGTTNTIIYAKCAGQQHELQFAARLRLFDTSRRDAKTNFQSYSSFLPAREIAPPFTTVMQGRPFSLRTDIPEELINKAEDPALWRDYIFFDKDIANTMSSIWDGSNGALHFNIKWSTSEKERERIARFLRQAGFMTLAELAAKGVSPDQVVWRYSYPLAMSEADSADFQNIARKVVSQLRDPGEGRAKSVPPVPGAALRREPVTFCSESTAAAVWFRQNARFGTTSQIIIDIGGGTTDLALWADDGPVWSDSFRIAGRNLVVEFLAQNRDFLNSLGVLETILQSANYRAKFLESSDNQEQFTDAVGVIVNSAQFADALRDRFSGIAGSPAGKKLQCGAYLFLGGLLYYVGLQVRALLGKSNQDVLHAKHLRTLSVCFAGRGSTIFTLLDEKRQSADSHLNRCLKLFVAGIQSPQIPIDELVAQPYFSRRPKHEVSEGMLYWDSITRSSPKETFSVLGEAVEGELADGSTKRLEPTDPESALEQLKRLGPPLVEEFARFIEQLGELTGVKFTLGVPLLGHLETKVSEALRAKLNPTAQSVHYDPDPPFIVMLRETLQKLYSAREDDSAIRVELR